MIDVKELLGNFAALQTQLKDIETHNGWLLSLAIKMWKEVEGIHVVEHHYTASGITAKVWLPSDKRYYRVTIQEEVEQKKNLSPMNPCQCEECQWCEKEIANG